MAQKKKPPRPSFSKNPSTKGSFLRAANDIDVAIKNLGVSRMAPISSFLFYYMACEKLAKIMKGVHNREKMTKTFSRSSNTPNAKNLTNYAKALGLSIVV